MVSGFVTSPRDHSLISSAATRPIEIFSSLLMSMSRSKPCTLYSSSLLVLKETHLTLTTGSLLALLAREGVGLLVQVAGRLFAGEIDPQGPRRLVPVAPVLFFGCSRGIVDRLDRKPQRLHLLEQDLEARRHPRLGDVLPLNDRLVALDPANPIVALYRQELLQGMRSTVRFQSPHLHLTKTLPAELGLSTQRLLCDERVRARRTGMYLVIYQVQELQYIHVADRNRAVERLAGTPVVHGHLATATHTRTVGAVFPPDGLDSCIDVLDLGAREHRCRDEDWLAAVLAQTPARRPPQMGLEDLADVHPARDSQGAQDHVQRGPILHKRHIFLGHDLGDNALVAVAPRELVALGDLTLCCHEDAYHLVNARLKLISGVSREALDVDDDAALPVRDL